jgi:hypothetical protein
MKLGQLGLNSPRIGGRGMGEPAAARDMGPGAAPPPSKPSMGRDLGTSSITSGMSAPPVKNLGSRIISALRARRRGMGAPRAGRRL